MNINYKEAQFEFFPGAAGSSDEARRPHFMAARFNLSIENLVIFSIVSIMVIVFSFSLGVEKGKRISLSGSEPQIGIDRTTDPVSKSSSSGTGLSAASIDGLKSAVTDPLPVQVKAGGTEGKIVTAEAAPQGLVAKSTGGYTVQVASYKSGKKAEKEAQALLKKGYKAFVLSKGQHVVLCVGNFQKREEAGIYGKKLKSNYQDFVVRRL
jgi:hypothetical protein